MVKRYMRTVLALLLCCAMLASNLGFAEELTELAAEVAAEAELAPEAAVEEAAEPEAALELEEPAPEADEAEAEPEEAQEAEPAEEPEADAAPEEGEAAEPGEVSEPEAPVEGEAAEPEAPEQDAEPAPDEEMGGGSQPELTPEEEHPVMLDPALEESLEGVEFAAEGCEHQWEFDPDTQVSTCQICFEECHHENAVPEGEPWLDEDDSPDNVVIKVGDPDVDLRPDPDCHYVKGPGQQPVYCEVCDVHFDQNQDEVIETFEHEWDANGLKCVDCNYAYEGCTHPHKAEEYGMVGRIPFDCTDPDDPHYPQDLGNGKHKAWGVNGTYTYCDDCGLQWNKKPDGEDHWITESHDFNGDTNENGEFICWICGKVNDCPHPNAQLNGEHFEAYDFDEGQGDTRDERRHHVRGKQVQDWYCPDCGAYYYTEEESVDDDVHDWDHEHGSVCQVCGYENTCDHEGTTEHPEWVENDWDREGGWEIRSDANGCSVWLCRYQEYHCWKCDAHWGQELIEDGFKREYQPHEWSEDDPSECNWCNYKNTCKHPRAEKEDEEGWYDPMEDGSSSDTSIGRRDAQGHYGIPAIHNFWWYCPDCEARYMTHEEEDSVDARHDWDDDNTCRICGYENTCDHEGTLDDYGAIEIHLNEDTSRNVITPEGHKVYCDILTLWHCTNCDAEFKTWSIDQLCEEEHVWDFNPEGESVCMYCGYANPCDHEGTTQSWDYEEPDYTRGNPVITTTELSHEVYVIRHHKHSCWNCGAEWEDEPEVGLRVVGDHEWYYDGDEDAVLCEMCGRENSCKHPRAEDRASDFVINANDPRNRITEDRHEVYGTYYYMKYCPDCDADFWVHEDGFEEGKHAWDWISFDGEPSTSQCVFCRKANPCDHPDSMLHPDERYFLDGNNYPDGGVIEEDDEGHRVHAIHATWDYCEECKSTVNYDEEPAGVIEGEHDYSDGGWECSICGHENSCGHENRVEIRGWCDPTDEMEVELAEEDWHRVLHVTYNAEYDCPDCGLNFTEHYEDQELEGPHEWDDDGKTCRWCGYENTCEHPVGVIFPEEWYELENDDERAVDNGHGHTGVFVKYAGTRCNQCGALFEVSILEGPEEMDLPHQWSYDDEGRTCDFCDAENDCRHEHVMEWVDVDNVDWEVAKIIEQTPEGHVMEITCRAELYCEDCGTTFQVVYDNYTLDEEHHWDSQNATPVCRKCGYVPECEHPEEKIVYNERMEIDDSRPDCIVSTNDEGHTAYMRKVGMYECLECGSNWGWTILEQSDRPEFYEHNWNDEGGSECEDCGYPNPCKHENRKYDEDSAEYEVTGETEVDWRNADGHSVSHLTRKVWFHCLDCDEDFVDVDDDFTLENEHWWNDEDGKTCWVCGYANPCNHRGTTETDTWLEPDDSYPDDGIISTNEKNHTYHARRVQESHCTECDARFGWEVIEDGFTLTEPHEWDGEEARTCEVCGEENPCKHPHASLENEWDEPYEFEDQPDSVTNHNWRQDEEHTVKGTHCQEWYCEDCDSWYRIDTEDADVECDHDWRWYPEEGVSRCWICGKENECEHKNSDEEEWWDLDDSEDIIDRDENGHMAWFWHSTGIQCDDCGARLNETEAEHVKDWHEHEWDEDDQCRTCGACGWENPCDHEGTTELVEIIEIHLSEDTSRNKITPEGHEVYCDARVHVHCTFCDSDFEIEWEDAPFIGDHEWVFNPQGDAVCKFCDYKNPCEHENVEVNCWVEADEESIEPSASGHTYSVVKATQQVCVDCGMELSEEPDREPLNKTITEPHKYDTEDDEGGAYCMVCGWENPCTKHTPTGGYTWSQFIRVGESSAAGHIVVLAKFHELVCANCGAHMGEEMIEGSEEELFVEHFYDGDTADDCAECLECGWKNPCSHEKHHTVTGQEPITGAFLRQTATSHTMLGYSYSYKQCDYCTATWGFQSEMGIELEEQPHRWDSVNGEYCIDCGYHNTCKHSGAKQTQDTLDPIYIQDLSTSEEHAYIQQTRNFKQCDSCGAKYDVKYVMAEPAYEAHDFGSGTVCSKCGFDRSKDATLTNLRFDTAAIVLGEGEKYTPVLEKTPASSASAITYKSGNTRVFTVNERTGEITAVAVGTADLTATGDGKTASVSVQVLPRATSIRLDEVELELPVGRSVELYAHLLPAGSMSDIRWSISDESVIRYDNGKLTALKLGDAVITATIRNGASVASADCVVHVRNEPSIANMSLEFEKDTIGEGETIDAWVEYNSACGDYTIRSNNVSVVSVIEINGEFELQGKSAGTATITAEAYNGVRVSEQITVVGAPTKLEFVNKPSKMGVGEHLMLDVKLSRTDGKECGGSVTFSSNKTAVIEVVDSETGELYAKKTGSAKITAKCGKLSKSVTISVKKAATSISLNQKSISIGVGETKIPTLKATLKPSGAAATVFWFSSNPDVVDVDEASGKLTIVDSGSAEIVASIYGGEYTDFCRVTVCNAPSPETMTLVAPERMVKGSKTVASVRFSGGTGGSYTLSSDKPSVLKVDKKTNTIRALKKGQATLTAEAYNGKRVSMLITVTPAPTAVKQVPKSQTMVLYDTFKITPEIAPAEAEDVLTATSSNDSVAYVSPDYDEGVFYIEARSIGTATITFKTSNNKKAKCKITVKSRPEEILNLHDLKDEKALVYSTTKKYTTTEKLKATLSPAGCGGEVKYESDNPSVAEVEKGSVVPKGLGYTTIHAFVEDGDGNHICETEFDVAVREAPTTANTKLEPEDDREPVNGKIQIHVNEQLSTKITHIGSAGDIKKNSYKSKSAKIAAVNKKTGVITGKKVGSTTISVKMYNGVTISLEIEVIP